MIEKTFEKDGHKVTLEDSGAILLDGEKVISPFCERERLSMHEGCVGKDYLVWSSQVVVDRYQQPPTDQINHTIMAYCIKNRQIKPVFQLQDHPPTDKVYGVQLEGLEGSKVRYGWFNYAGDDKFNPEEKDLTDVFKD